MVSATQLYQLMFDMFATLAVLAGMVVYYAFRRPSAPTDIAVTKALAMATYLVALLFLVMLLCLVVAFAF